MPEEQTEQPKNVSELGQKAPEASEKSPEQRLGEAKDSVKSETVGEVSSDLKIIKQQIRPKEAKAGLDKLHELYSDSKYKKNNGEKVPQVKADLDAAFVEMKAAQKAGDVNAEKVAQAKVDDLYKKGVDWSHDNERTANETPASIKNQQETLKAHAKGGRKDSAERKATNLEAFIKAGGMDAGLAERAGIINKNFVENVQKINPEQRAALLTELGEAKKEMSGMLAEIESAAKDQMIPENEENAVLADAQKKAEEIGSKLEAVRKMIVEAGYKYDNKEQKVVRD